MEKVDSLIGRLVAIYSGMIGWTGSGKEWRAWNVEHYFLGALHFSEIIHLEFQQEKKQK